MAQKQTKRAERGLEALVCTHGNCKKLQTADGEFCEKHYPKQNKYIEALNRLDELASYATQDNDNGEAEQQEKDYNLLFDFLNKK